MKWKAYIDRADEREERSNGSEALLIHASSVHARGIESVELWVFGGVFDDGLEVVLVLLLNDSEATSEGRLVGRNGRVLDPRAASKVPEVLARVNAPVDDGGDEASNIVLNNRAMTRPR